MKWLDLTLPTPDQNLAFDQALLDHCEDGLEGDVLRFWEPGSTFVVLGYSNRWRTEVNVDACENDGIPIRRRCSGGGTVVQASGCLNYTLLLRLDEKRPLSTITETNRYVLERHSRALEPLLGTRPHIQGHTDLTLGPLKFSGNSQRRKRYFTLMHGTFLLRFDVGLLEAYLPFPSLAPAYRKNRPHRDFVTNLSLSPDQIKNALKKEWETDSPLTEPPIARTETLVHERYSRDEWNRRF